jgi:hypothetical protein
MAAQRADTGDWRTIEGLVLAYYRALEQGAPLAPFFVTDDGAGELGPPLKIGTAADEVYAGWTAIAQALDRVAATLSHNRLESRGLLTREAGAVGWYFDQVWWSGEEAGRPFASLTRWTGVCLRGPDGRWRFLQMHVSEGREMEGVMRHT